MLRRRLWIAARFLLAGVLVPVLAGWAALIALTYFAARPLILLTAPLVGAHWVATAQVSFACLTLAATGWVIGRLNPSAPLPGLLVFAVTLAAFNFDPSLGIDVPTLVRLAIGARHDAHYLNPLATTAVEHLFLFGSLIVGGLLSRPSPAPLSLFRENRR